jgi:hypothetical protein
VRTLVGTVIEWFESLSWTKMRIQSGDLLSTIITGSDSARGGIMKTTFIMITILVQCEMGRGRTPLVSIPPLGQDHCSSVLQL